MMDDKKEEEPKEDILAPKYDQVTNDDGQTPREDVVAPKYDQITQGYDPIKEKTSEKGLTEEEILYSLIKERQNLNEQIEYLQKKMRCK